MVHPHAIYMQEGQTYEVSEYNEVNKRATLKPVAVDYYTMPVQKSEVTLENLIKREDKEEIQINLGEICVTSQVIGYKKQLWETNQILSNEEIEMPVSELHTVGFWLCLTKELENQLRESGFWSASRNYYGKNWEEIRNAIRARDQYTCQVCGKKETGTTHHVHHKIPFKSFKDPEAANRPDNLITLCFACHQRAEMRIKIKSGLAGLAYMMHELAPVFTMCDEQDLGVFFEPQSVLGGGLPTVVLYDQVPAGIGLASQIYDDHEKLLKSSYELVSTCRCKDGCPSCVGPAGDTEVGGKAEAAQILKMILNSD